jgi:hypothetical protein
VHAEVGDLELGWIGIVLDMLPRRAAGGLAATFEVTPAKPSPLPCGMTFVRSKNHYLQGRLMITDFWEDTWMWTGIPTRQIS